jgi:hypothetical protein
MVAPKGSRSSALPHEVEEIEALLKKLGAREMTDEEYQAFNHFFKRKKSRQK